jgi:hypothetical protein
MGLFDKITKLLKIAQVGIDRMGREVTLDLQMPLKQGQVMFH